MSEVKRYEINGTFDVPETGQKLVNPKMVMESDFDRVTAERYAALAEVDRLKNMDHRQILAESAAKYLLDSGAENFVGDVFTIEADDGKTKFEVIVTTQRVGAKSPGELCNELQQRLTAADELCGSLERSMKNHRHELGLAQQRVDQLEELLRRVHKSTALTKAVDLWQRIDAALKPAEGGGDA